MIPSSHSFIDKLCEAQSVTDEKLNMSVGSFEISGIPRLAEAERSLGGGKSLERSNPLQEGGVATPIKQMQRYLSFGVAGEVTPQRNH
jgi:hypothetical protein